MTGENPDELPTDDLPGETRVFRVIRPDEVMPASDGRQRPKSSEFTDHREDNAMSVFLESDVTAAGRSIEQVLECGMFEPGSHLYWLPLSYYRENGQIVTRAAIDAFPGHANVRDANGKRSGGLQTRMAKNSIQLERGADPAGGAE